MKVLTPSVLAGDRNPGGADTQIQYNNGGSLAGSADLTWDDTAKELGVGGDINLDDGGTYATTLQLITPTANRTISFPDATGTVGLVGGSSGQLVYNNAGAYAGVPSSAIGASGDITLSLAGAASTPPVSLTGTWFSGGTSTTTKPQLLIEPTGTTSTAWSTDGTGLGVNAASGFGGNLLDLQVNGSSKLYVNKDGNIAVPAGSQSAPSISVGTTDNGIYSPGADQVAISTNGTGRLFVDANGQVGIGTFPSTLLQLEASSNNQQNIYIRNSNTGSSACSAISVNTSTAEVSLRANSASHSVWPATALLAANSGFTNGLALNTGTAAPIAFLTNNSERMRLDSSGRLGLGTSSPGATLHVEGPGNTVNQRIFTSDNVLNATASLTFGTTPGSRSKAAIRMINSNTGNAAGDLSLLTDSGGSGLVSRLYINSAGNVGVGTTSPSYLITAATSADGVDGVSVESPSFNGVIRLRADGTNGNAIRVGGIGAQSNTLRFLVGSDAERARIDSSGRFLVGTSSDSGGALLQVNGDRVRIATAKTPASATDTGTAGEICWDANYVYVCTATNTWKRSALSTW